MAEQLLFVLSLFHVTAAPTTSNESRYVNLHCHHNKLLPKDALWSKTKYELPLNCFTRRSFTHLSDESGKHCHHSAKKLTESSHHNDRLLGFSTLRGFQGHYR